MVPKLVMLWNRPRKSLSVLRKPVTFRIGRGSSGEEPVMKKPILHWNRPWKIPLQPNGTAPHFAFLAVFLVGTAGPIPHFVKFRKPFESICFFCQGLSKRGQQRTNPPFPLPNFSLTSPFFSLFFFFFFSFLFFPFFSLPPKLSLSSDSAAKLSQSQKRREQKSVCWCACCCDLCLLACDGSRLKDRSFL